MAKPPIAGDAEYRPVWTPYPRTHRKGKSPSETRLASWGDEAPIELGSEIVGHPDGRETRVRHNNMILGQLLFKLGHKPCGTNRGCIRLSDAGNFFPMTALRRGNRPLDRSAR